jgi:diaminopimelate decarboxylase
MDIQHGSFAFGNIYQNSLSEAQCQKIAEIHDTPARVYFAEALEQAARHTLSIPHAYGLTVRFAMKANPLKGIVQLFNSMGIEIDASSQYEVRRALSAGIPASQIQLTAQEWPREDSVLQEFSQLGVILNPCSLTQLRRFAKLFPDAEVGFRVNPGLGSGGTNRTNTGGPGSSFGIWHEALPEVVEIIRAANLRLTRLHSHIGSGSDVAVWEHCADLTLDVAARLLNAIPEARNTLKLVNLGGGYKVARMEDEKHTDLHQAFLSIETKLRSFAATHGPQLKLEIEPGTFLVAHSGLLLCRVQDFSDTGNDGYNFLKVDAGMTELIRPSLYGAQHPISLLPYNGRKVSGNEDYVIVGHCCESGDIFSPARGAPEELATRSLPKAEVGDFVLIGGAGAYAEGFSVVGYNSFPTPAAVLIQAGGEMNLLKRRGSEHQASDGEV